MPRYAPPELASCNIHPLFWLPAMIGWCWLGKVAFDFCGSRSFFGQAPPPRLSNYSRELAARRFNTLIVTKEAGGKNTVLIELDCLAIRARGYLRRSSSSPPRNRASQRATKAENQDPSSSKQRLPESPGRGPNRGGVGDRRKEKSVFRLLVA